MEEAEGRGRRHATLAVQQHQAGVRPEEYWEYRPQQRVHTTDGFPGHVERVEDGPFPGAEEYHVILDGGMGGGRYTASQLRPAAATTAAAHTAAEDYPELAEVLRTRPDPALPMYAARASQATTERVARPSDAVELLSALVTTAAADQDFRFHVTAAWRDVVAKAKRIRSEGRLRVTLASDGLVYAEVKGDHYVYETGLQRMPGRTAAHAWGCGCKWGAYHWGADDDFSRFAGRMCSHALALQFEAQSRGMFGRDINADGEKPSWVPRKVVVRYDIDADQHRLAPATGRSLASWNPREPTLWDEEAEHDPDHAADRRAKSDEWDSIHEGLGDLHRGVNVHLRPEDHAIVHDMSRPLHERAQHLLKALPHSDLARGHGGLGRHWTDNEGVAESFGEMDARPNRHGTHPTSVIFHAQKPDRDAIDEEPDQSDGLIYGYHDHGESEVPLRPGAGVTLKGISWKNMDTPDEDFQTFEGDGLFDHLWDHQRHTFGPHGHGAYASLAPASVIARAAVAAGEDREEVLLALAAAGVYPEQWGDDEDGYRYHATDDGDRVYPCHNKYCEDGGEHEDGESARRHADVYTDWDLVHPHLGSTLHRGMALDLPEHVHDVVHDERRPAAERATALADHLREEGLGTHWTPDHDQAKHYAGITDGRARDTHVVLHAHTPGKDAIETDPDTLADQDVIAMGEHDDAEVPLRYGAGVSLKGISWRQRTEPRWTRHDFPGGLPHTASAEAPFGEPSGTSYRLPATPGATSPRRAWENPASAGPLAGADPVGWNRKLPLESYAALAESALFEPGGAEATLHEEPEGALPATDGTQIPSDDEALSPAVARLRRQALKDFSAAERQALINEGEGVRAANLDRLDISGTHYADLEQVLASQEDDTTWLI